MSLVPSLDFSVTSNPALRSTSTYNFVNSCASVSSLPPTVRCGLPAAAAPGLLPGTIALTSAPITSTASSCPWNNPVLRFATISVLLSIVTALLLERPYPQSRRGERALHRAEPEFRTERQDGHRHRAGQDLRHVDLVESGQ